MTIFRRQKEEKRVLRSLFHMGAPREAFEGPSVFASVVGRRELPNMPGTIPDGTPRKLPKMPGTIPDGATARASSKLSDLKPGESGVVCRLSGRAQGRLRLMEMGITPGAEVKVIHAAAFGGPLQITVRGYQLSLRREEASAVVLC